ncbi:differentially expressed in FDCP 8 homolog A-like [Pomacea canaliculata]|nr:differentially expressed in FDCP 8 homolog A-like [Pomacea canaliculata]XP_025087006.1 differentially expressed in FDCP 8 homolog A-like [Pomacea canaliculata]
MTESIIRAMSCSSGSSMQELYYQSRFNPFDRDFHLEEDHFSDNPESNLFDRKNSSPTSISSCLDSGDIINNDHEYSQESDEGQVTFAELGLAEDHFSHPEGHFGLSKTEELELAISNCKELIIAAPTNSDRQKNLVSKLIQLRIKLQEIKEGPAPVEPNMLIVMGHVFKKKTSHSSKYYCEKCNKVIWGMLQEWHRCIECGYRCHDKCVQLITRTCAIVKVKENPAFIYDLCPRNPKGLAAQDFRCAECRMHISGSDGMEARLCEYNGRYYCEMCHWNDLMYIPAQILHNWDFEKRKVCRASKQFLKLMRTKPVIRVQDVNPMLFNYVEQLRDIKHLREELLIMKKYILACPAAMAAKLLLQLSSWPHFVECSDRYSVQDLLDSDDSLIPDLVQVHSSWAQHIKTECQVCQGRGFVCELCSEKEVLFPFDNTAVVCCSCSNVMHRICFAQKGVCQRCERRKKRQQDHVETL